MNAEEQLNILIKTENTKLKGEDEEDDDELNSSVADLDDFEKKLKQAKKSKGMTIASSDDEDSDQDGQIPRSVKLGDKSMLSKKKLPFSVKCNSISQIP